MIILGIDPGLATLGWGVIESAGGKLRPVQYGTLGTPPGETLPHRLRSIFIGIQQLMQTYAPDEIAFEELFFAKNVTTGMTVSAARGAALVAVAEKNPNLYEYTPMQVKQAVVGYGKAEKRQVQQMVKMLLGLAEIPKPDDAADALAVAITHAHTGAARARFQMK
ncbi:MAG: crossover junction endodeoxyribonuclease RuvC [Oscillospiraceae bacterium]|jgi:crossover junction endodeoxyribonuclease RuvC|nr:crossover junction endodeoxyribonuclease RuvC [Oscillospiraceae bacterium]